MTNLGDYVGQLIAEITLARVKADLESVRLADYYANHPLLKSFPVPRFRLPDVTLDFPVAIAGVPAPDDAKPMDVAEARRVFSSALDEQFDAAGVKLTPQQRERVTAAVAKRFDALKIPELVSTSSVAVADAATSAVEEALPPKSLEGEARLRFIDGLRNRSRVAMLKLLPSPLRVQVVTTTAELRELPAQQLTRLQLKVTEQGVEWKGDGVKKLVPE